MILGALAAVMLWRFRFPGKTQWLKVNGAADCRARDLWAWAMRLFFARLPCPTGRWLFNSAPHYDRAHLICLPFVATVVRARASPFNRELEEAAKIATEWRTFWDVLVPHMQPGLFRLSQAFGVHLVARMISSSHFFTAGPDTDHVPVVY